MPTFLCWRIGSAEFGINTAADKTYISRTYLDLGSDCFCRFPPLVLRCSSGRASFMVHTGSLSAPPIKPPRHVWAQWIGPETLISQVRSTAPFLEPRLPATEPGRLIELGRLPAHSRQLGEYSAHRPPPRGAVAGLLRFMPGLSSRYRRHVRAYRRRYQNPRYRLARVARPRCTATHAALGPRLARLD
jgi:hypothetical protein